MIWDTFAEKQQQPGCQPPRPSCQLLPSDLMGHSDLSHPQPLTADLQTNQAKAGCPRKASDIQLTPEAATSGLDSSIVMLPPEGHGLRKAQAANKRRITERQQDVPDGESQGSKRVPGRPLRSCMSRAGPLRDAKDRWWSRA